MINYLKYQNNLINKINSFNDLPHSLLLLGDRGSGHESVCEYISNKFNLFNIDITDKISYEYINEIYLSNSRTLYVVNIDDIDVYRQSMLLKLFEEPNKYAYVILNCSSEDLILDTLKNRSYLLRFDQYSPIQLKEFINSNTSEEDVSLILNVCSTPGQIEIANYTNMQSLYQLCNKILSSLNTANFQNALSISDKINFSDEYDKFNFELFFKMIKYSLLYSNINNKISVYNVIINHSKYIYSMTNKKSYFENMIIQLIDVMNN